MLAQQNMMDESSQNKQGISAPGIDKIDYQANRIKNLISHLRMNKRRSSGEVSNTPFHLQNQCQISNIEPISQKLDKNSFQLQLQNQIPIRRNTMTMTPLVVKNKSIDKQGNDKGLKYKPRGAVNGRDDIRVRNLNQIHKKIIGSLEKKRNQYQSEHKQQQKLEYALLKLDQIQNPQNNYNGYLGSQSKIRLANSSLRKKQNNTQRLTFAHNLSESRQQKFYHSAQKFLIQPKQLLQFLQKINHNQYPTSDCTPSKIYQFFTRIGNNFGIQSQFNEPLIKRYKNCIYFGHKVAQTGKYMGFVWYFRNALYYGEFQKGRKNGYGVQIDLQEKDNWCIWKGSFLNGKKTGYFQMMSPKLEYNGALVNSYFEGQGMLKMKNYSVYKGTFHAGMKHGFGVQNFINKKSLSYKGEYFQNKFEGKGQLEGSNYYYKGTFRNNKPHGQGFQRTDEFQYQGQFKNGKRSGKGILKLQNGQQYDGVFQNGQLIQQRINKPQKAEPRLKNYASANQYIKSIKIQSSNKYYQQNSLMPSTILLQQSKIKSPLKNSPEIYKNEFSSRNNSNKVSKKQLPQVQSIRNINVANYSSRIVPLQKHLSKRLSSLYQQNQNQQGTIDQNKNQPVININDKDSQFSSNNKNKQLLKLNKINHKNIQNGKQRERETGRLRQRQRQRENINFFNKVKENQNSDGQEQPLEIKILSKG